MISVQVQEHVVLLYYVQHGTRVPQDARVVLRKVKKSSTVDGEPEMFYGSVI